MMKQDFIFSIGVCYLLVDHVRGEKEMKHLGNPTKPKQENKHKNSINYMA